MSDFSPSNPKRVKHEQIDWDESLKEKSWEHWDLSVDISDEELIAEREKNWLKFYANSKRTQTKLLPTQYGHCGNYPQHQIIQIWICSICNRACKAGADLHSDCTFNMRERCDGLVSVDRRSKTSGDALSISSDSTYHQLSPAAIIVANAPIPSPMVTNRSEHRSSSNKPNNDDKVDNAKRRHRDDHHHRSSSSTYEKSSKHSHRHRYKRSRHHHRSRESRRHSGDEDRGRSRGRSRYDYDKKRHRANSKSIDRKRHRGTSRSRERKRHRDRSGSRTRKRYRDNSRHGRNGSRQHHRNASKETIRCSSRDFHQNSSLETIRCDSRGIIEISPQNIQPDPFQALPILDSDSTRAPVRVSVSNENGSLIRHYNAEDVGIGNYFKTPDSAHCISVPMELIQKEVTHERKLSESKIIDIESESVTEDSIETQEEEDSNEAEMRLSDNEDITHMNVFCPNSFEDCLNSPTLDEIVIPETNISGLKASIKKEDDVETITLDSDVEIDSSSIPRAETLNTPQVAETSITPQIRENSSLCRISQEIENLLLANFPFEHLVNVLQFLVNKPSMDTLNGKLNQYPEILFKGINAPDKNASYLIGLVKSIFKDVGTTQGSMSSSELINPEVSPYDILRFFNILRSSNFLDSTYCQRIESTQEISFNVHLLLGTCEELLSRLLGDLISEECSNETENIQQQSVQPEFTGLIGQTQEWQDELALAIKLEKEKPSATISAQDISTNMALAPVTATVTTPVLIQSQAEKANVADATNPADLLAKYIQKYEHYDLCKPKNIARHRNGNEVLDLDKWCEDNLPKSSPTILENESSLTQITIYPSSGQNYENNILPQRCVAQTLGENYILTAGQSQMDHMYRQNSYRQVNIPMEHQMLLQNPSHYAPNQVSHQTCTINIPNRDSSHDEFKRVLDETPRRHYSAEVSSKQNQIWTPESRYTLTSISDLQNPNTSNLQRSSSFLKNIFDETGPQISEHQGFSTYEGGMMVAGNLMTSQNSTNMYSTRRSGNVDQGQQQQRINPVQNQLQNSGASSTQRSMNWNDGNNRNGNGNSNQTSCLQVTRLPWIPQTAQPEPCFADRGPLTTLHYGPGPTPSTSQNSGGHYPQEQQQQQQRIPQQYEYRRNDQHTAETSPSDEHDLSPLSVTGWSEQQQRQLEQQQAMRINIHQRQQIEQENLMRTHRAHTRIQPQPQFWNAETTTMQQHSAQYQYARQQQQQQQRLNRAQQLAHPQQQFASEHPTTTYCPQRGHSQQHQQVPRNGGPSKNVTNQYIGNLNDGNVQFGQNIPESISTHVNCTELEEASQGESDLENYQNILATTTTQSDDNEVRVVESPTEHGHESSDIDFIHELLGF